VTAARVLASAEPLNWNEDLFGPPQEALDAAAAELARGPLYPERGFADFRDARAGWRGVPSEMVIPAHGAQSLIGTIATAFVDPGTRVVIPRMTYGLYAQGGAAGGAEGTAGGPAPGPGGDARCRGSTRTPEWASPSRRWPPPRATRRRGWSGCAIPTPRPAT